jgi:phenol hydroxylase P0 protein
MILPEEAFREFCEMNGVRFLSDEEGAALDADREKWRGGAIRSDGQRGPSS